MATGHFFVFRTLVLLDGERLIFSLKKILVGKRRTLAAPGVDNAVVLELTRIGENNMAAFVNVTQ